MDVAFEERLLAAGSEDAVYRLAGIRQAHREQEHLDLLTGQTDRHVTEVDLSFRPRRWVCGMNAFSVPRPASYLRPADSDIGPRHRTGHLRRTALIQQPVEEPLDGVPLLARPSRSARSIWSMAGLNTSSLVLRGGSCLRGSGQTDSMAAFAVRKPTPYLRCRARFDIPARVSRRIAAYRSTLDFGGTGGPLTTQSTPSLPPQASK
ncbi:hypothetical protein ACGFZQ_35200 [Streptomyces sp. NPDC048254]|uniref:hypothetical protein n=1 Tax=Streptomyces sp. NPDC048254 TaxID=3365525 RepID=UPI0037180FC4